MIELQLLTGMRPGEVCAMRPADVDTTGAVWVYRPGQHKLAYRGRPREVVLGPKAQAVLRAFAPPGPGDYYFSPRRAIAGRRAERAAARRTPRYPSHARAAVGKRVAAPTRRPAERYNVSGYGHAVARGCDRAFPPPAPLARRPDETVGAWQARLTPAEREQLAAWRAAHRWHPNQLRHTFATAVRKAHGLEAAQVLLGHAKADVTQVYAERDAGLAARVAAEVG
jgi:integrase